MSLGTLQDSCLALSGSAPIVTYLHSEIIYGVPVASHFDLVAIASISLELGTAPIGMREAPTARKTAPQYVRQWARTVLSC